MEECEAFVASLAGERIGGRYVVEHVLGVGGMGFVAAGRYPELDQEVAIKFMLPDLAANTQLAARFLREARLAARVKSPHFVRVFDFGKHDSNVPYLVMELLHGRTVGEELERRGPLPIEDAVDFVLQAAVGLAELHALGIVHRDLKPSNLFLAEAAGTRTVKVLDFGISKERQGSGNAITTTGSMIGTPAYMSPEQIKESRHADARSDIWSLGVILYELLTAQIPFGGDGEAPGAIYGLILHTDPVPLRTRKPDLPLELEAAVLKCLVRDVDARYADVGELAEALRAFAPVRSHHRIDAIHHALAHAAPIKPAGSGPELAASPVPLSHAPTTPAFKRDSRPPARDPSIGAQTSLSAAARSNDVPAPSQPRSRRAWIVAAIAAPLLALAAFVALRSTGTSTSTSAAAAPPATSITTATATATAASLAPSAAPEPTPVASASAPPSASASAPAPLARVPQGVGRVVTPLPVAPPAPPPAKTGNVLDQLDRK